VPRPNQVNLDLAQLGQERGGAGEERGGFGSTGALAEGEKE